MTKPAKSIFISYAHKDNPFFEVFRDGLISHLYTSDKYDFGVWQDSQIHLGSFWDNEIQQNLGKAGIAILCVSANFLNSKYIAAKEFRLLTEKFPQTLIVPVYFNHCNINAWDDLARRQFFKPSGDEYDRAGERDFAFCDLVKFSQDGQPLPNANTDKYFLDIVRKIEISLGARVQDDQVPAAVEESGKDKPGQSPEGNKSYTDKIVIATIVASMIGTAALFFYFLAFTKSAGQEMMYKSSVSGAMFFATIAAYTHNKKQKAI